MEYQDILNSISDTYQSILNKNLVGIYLHGSIVLGCFNWNKSDIDFIAVINEELSHQVKRELMDFIVELNKQAPPKGIEMSIVLKKHCQQFTYPTPFELHFSNTHREWYRKDPAEYCHHMNGVDKDLAAHFTIIKHAGVVICGNPISEVFGDVPKADYLDSIKYDIQNAKTDIFANPLYTVLTLCRVAAFTQNSLVLSKEQGGNWGNANLKEEFRDLIGRALHSYQTDEVMTIGVDEANSFCDYMFGLIF